MEELEKKLNYTFHRRELLEEALNHSSYANEHRAAGLHSNERLEFLGDSVLGFVTAEFLFRLHPEAPEGDLTRILADAMEAVFAAVYLDGGIDAAKDLIHRLLLDAEREEAVEERRRDYKTALQELVQRTPGTAVTYQLVEESGPDHCRVFVMEASVGGEPAGRGEGRSKKEAEQAAARAALEAMGEE